MSYKHIMVAIDLAEPSDTVISRAVSLAKNLDAKLSFVTVDIHYDPDNQVYDAYGSKMIRESKEEMETKLDELLSSITYPIENKVVVMGEVEQKLIDETNKLHADLLVSGHHHGFWQSWWSSAKKLLNIATVDLLLISI